MSCHLHPLDDEKLEQMADMQAVSRCVKTDIEGDLPFVERLFDRFFVGCLGNQPTPFEFLKHRHDCSPFPLINMVWYNRSCKNAPPLPKEQRA